jgi:hypothetical protein
LFPLLEFWDIARFEKSKDHEDERASEVDVKGGDDKGEEEEEDDMVWVGRRNRCRCETVVNDDSAGVVAFGILLTRAGPR